ncbi:hypothetical protein M378DRAFT_792816 [Amanita muscaria Koide BX008]|uniref:Uncharacterized protein n=1 Tax=Amanita muscaria (strain Koide BX008) TaxID=946122 RepID=A0A0C2WZT6_AMAMK|nr:hypothetical protein M378DRAFT_792816 [Amanita muscaria Koide BX008]
MMVHRSQMPLTIRRIDPRSTMNLNPCPISFKLNVKSSNKLFNLALLGSINSHHRCDDPATKQKAAYLLNISRCPYESEGRSTGDVCE